MPELPEVETVRSQLETLISGKTISDIDVRRTSIVRGNLSLLIGKKITSVQRFSKLLVLQLNDLSVAIHLKMTGRLIVEDPKQPEYKEGWEFDYNTYSHTHIVFKFDSGERLYFSDYRRFGTVQIIDTSLLPSLPYIKQLGKEFFVTLDDKEFYRILQTTSRAIKTVLLDQTKIAGVGNIYANESLWKAYIHPERPAKTLSQIESTTLFIALEEVMKAALLHHGASSDNFRDVYGKKGTAQQLFYVYGKQGTPCLRCGTSIFKYMMGGRGTYICEECQKK